MLRARADHSIEPSTSCGPDGLSRLPPVTCAEPALLGLACASCTRPLPAVPAAAWGQRPRGRFPRKKTPPPHPVPAANPQSRVLTSTNFCADSEACKMQAPRRFPNRLGFHPEWSGAPATGARLHRGLPPISASGKEERPGHYGVGHEARAAFGPAANMAAGPTVWAR